MNIGLDLGGSGLRARDEHSGLQTFPSQYERVADSSRVHKGDIKDVFSDFTIISSPYIPANGHRYARGEATEYLRGVSSQVDNATLKVDQISTYVNATHAMAIKVAQSGLVNPTVTVGVCIPTSEYHSTGSDRIKERLAGTYTVKFSLTDEIVKFTVETVYVYPEGVIALASLLRNKELLQLITTRTGVIIDGGRRSTDVTVMKNGRPIAGAARSLPIGGLNLEALTAIELETAGYMVSGDSLTCAIAEGYIMDSSNEIAVGGYVDKSKAALSGLIRSSLNEVLAARAIQMRELTYVIYMGRCFDVYGAESRDGRFTGDLGAHLINEMNTDITRINVDNNETANIDAVWLALSKVAA